MKNKTLQVFESNFGNPLIYVKSPGRANIIGEHTDYNHGLVFPFAIEQSIHMHIGKNMVGKLRMIALDIDENSEIDMSEIEFEKTGWTRYFINCLVAIKQILPHGIDIVFGGNLPQGGGVSSSSALACGFLSGVNAMFGLGYDKDHLINLASQAENGIGLNGGIMDQTAIIKGQMNKALRIDFYDFTVKAFDMPSDEYNFYLFNSGQKHNLVDTEYNTRRATCESALRQVKAIDPSVETLRQMKISHIDSIVDGEIAKKRCIHVIEENKRVLRASEALEAKNIEALGPLLLESHQSLSSNYEVSTPEIDFLVARTQQIDNILGSRIMGGGFGGCTINLSKGELLSSDLAKLKEDYTERTGYELLIHEINASDGVTVEKLSPQV